MREKKTIALVIWFLICGTISQASDFPLSKLNLLNSQTEQKSIALTPSGNLPLQQEQGPNTSTPRATLEEDEDDTSKEKILNTATFVPSDFDQPLYFTHNIFETLDLEILTPPPQK
jgi:hypothetical protein